MKFYPKIGRLNDEEQAVIKSIDNLIESKQIPSDKLRLCNTFDELVELQTELIDFEPTITTDQQFDVITSDDNEHIDDTVSTHAELEDDNVTLVDSDPIPNEENRLADLEQEDESELDFISNDYDPFADEIIERSYNVSGKENPTEQVHSEPTDESEELNLQEASSTPVDNLNPKTKQRAAEQTADAILKGYARIAPMPFKYLAKVDEATVERMSMEGVIDITIEVEDGMTFDEYMRQTNEQVDEIFAVEQDTLEEIREPLIEVLMEQQMELTPQQRLMMAVISHLFQMLTVALKLRKQNNRILQYQKHITQMQR